MDNILLLLFMFLAWVVYYLQKRQRPTEYYLPPGPNGLPLIGNNHQIFRNAPLQLSSWANKYGKLFTIRIANGQTALVVNDAIMMKEIFGRVESTGKFGSELFNLLFGGKYGVANTEGSVWQEQRKFCAKSMKEFGLGKGSELVPTMLSEIEDFCCWLEGEMHANGKVQLSEKLKETSGNTLWTIITGEKMETNLPSLLSRFENSLYTAANSGLAFFPCIKYVAPEWCGYNSYIKVISEIRSLVKDSFSKIMNVRENNLSENSNIISSFIEHIMVTRDPESSFYGELGMNHGIQSVVALLLAGTEPTSVALHWLIIYLSCHPKVQNKLHKEIDEVIGKAREPTLSDRIRMPYTDAVIQETLRRSSVGPLGLMQRLLQDVDFHGYKLPKGLLLIPNIYHVHNDKTVWGDPENFRPERFTAGKMNLKEYMVAFQPGKRTCIGEAIARDTMFLFTTKLINKFHFSRDEDYSASEYMQPKVGLLMVPKNHNIVITSRHKNM